jgi:hypothetical protein
MRTIDVNIQGRIWEYRPYSHQTEHHHKERSSPAPSWHRTVVSLIPRGSRDRRHRCDDGHAAHEDDGGRRGDSTAPERKPQGRAGQLLLCNLRPGDHLIITRFDRVFRWMEDFITAYKLLQTRGVMIHVLDAPGDPNTANGRAMVQLLCVFAE